ncbi:hypothetical protein Tco_1152010 [Tanacetum coccineum]
MTNNCRLDTPEACQDMANHIVLPGNWIKAAFEEFKKYEDDRVTSRCAEIGCKAGLTPARYWMRSCNPQICGDRSVARCVEQLSKAYDPVADDKFTTALQAIKDLEYPLVDQLERLKDAPIDLIMASLYLESDTGVDAPQFIRDLRPSSSQLKIPIYPEVRDPKNPWAFEEEILLEDVIAANISCVEKKKKKNRVACRTHGVGSTHHARSDGVPVSVPTVAPQGLKIMLADAATQTEVSEDEGSPRLLRSKSLPPMFNLDWS